LDTGEKLVKTKDLFAGCFVTIMPHDDVWLVALHTDDQKTVSMKTYGELPDAMEAVHEWMLMLSDEMEVRVDDNAVKEAADLVRESLARMALGEEIKMPKELDEVILRDELRTWFERAMGGE
jgi:hypothetical protein